MNKVNAFDIHCTEKGDWYFYPYFSEQENPNNTYLQKRTEHF